MSRKSCAFSLGRRCAVLTRWTCAGCSFFKTKEQLDEGRKKAEERLKTLPNWVQVSIRETYHKEGDVE